MMRLLTDPDLLVLEATSLVLLLLAARQKARTFAFVLAALGLAVSAHHLVARDMKRDCTGLSRDVVGLTFAATAAGVLAGALAAMSDKTSNGEAFATHRPD